jgi:uncharacterized protein YegL
MASRRDATQDGYNEFIEDLQANAKGEVLVTLVEFDTEVTIRYAEKPLAEVPKLTDYHPGGMTALRDGLGKGINLVEKRVRKGDAVNVTLMTDGAENSSREYTHEQILAQKKNKEADGWTFNFLGAGPEAWNAGAGLGFVDAQRISYGMDAQSQKAAFKAVTASNVGTTSGLRGVSASYSNVAADVKSNLEGNTTPPPLWSPDQAQIDNLTKPKYPADDGDDGDPS